MSNSFSPETITVDRDMDMERVLAAACAEHEKNERREIETAVREAEIRILNDSNCQYNHTTLFEIKTGRVRIKSTIHGVLSYTGQHRRGVSFSATDGMHIANTYACGRFIKGINPLIDFFVEKEIILVLKGVPVGDFFLVNEIHSTGVLRDSGSRYTKIGDLAIQSIISRVVCDSDPLCMNKEYHRSYLPSSEEELKLLYPVVKRNLPAYLQDWADHSFNRVSSNMSRDEKVHALRAISYILNINWASRFLQMPELSHIKSQLDTSFFGLETVKTRILEVAAQIRRTGALPHWGILLNGPAGVGKTTIAKAIARVLNLPLVTLDMSTIKDPEGLIGSSRIYGNARSGLVLEKLLEARDSNCVFLLNELDKAGGSDNRGNPADTLLTLVDKLGFIDTFMETCIDTRNMFFIATCNEIDRISKPLQDRFLRIDIPRYTVSEKEQIFSRYVFPKALSNANVVSEELTLADESVHQLCGEYATEPGVRDLEQYAERIIGDYLLRVEQEGILEKNYTPNDIAALLGKKSSIERTVSVSSGQVRSMLIHNELVSQFLVQAKARPGSGQLNLIGIPSDFHRDCCRVAYECAKSCSSVEFDKIDISLYVPNIIPSSTHNYLGCASFMAIMSAVTGRVLPETSVFIGGCDLMGNLFWDESSIIPILEVMEHNRCTCLYGPMKVNCLATGHSHKVKVIESFNAAILFEVAEYIR